MPAPDVAALSAIHQLGELVREAAREAAEGEVGHAALLPPLLRLHVRLRAAADELVEAAPDSSERCAVRLASTMFLSLVVWPSLAGHSDVAASAAAGAATASTLAAAAAADMHRSDTALARDALLRRSERYIAFASRSTSQIAAHAIRQAGEVCRRRHGRPSSTTRPRHVHRPLREMLAATPRPAALYSDSIVGAWIAWKRSDGGGGGGGGGDGCGGGGGAAGGAAAAGLGGAGGGDGADGAGGDGAGGDVREGGRWGGVGCGCLGGSLGCVLTLGASPAVWGLLSSTPRPVTRAETCPRHVPQVTELLSTAAATEHFTVLVAEGRSDG